MNDNLFEMLMDFFETSLSKISEDKAEKNNQQDGNAAEEANFDSLSMPMKAAQASSIRVFTPEEQVKFTKASYQFITRMMMWSVITSENMEIIIEQLLNSESRFVTLDETKWTIRTVMADHFDDRQMAFLDLVLYQKEDNLKLH